MKRYLILFAVLSLVAGIFWIGCESAPTGVNGSGDDEFDAGKAVLPDVALENIIKVQNRHTARLMKISGVVGTASGVGADGSGAVLVLTKTPGVGNIPKSLDGERVVVKVVGEIRAFPKPEGKGKPGGNTTDPVDPTTRFDRPVPIGVSTGHPAITAGTIGARVTDGTRVFALSNNHVYADENTASTGDAVLQPGTYDEGEAPADTLGTLFDFEPIDFSGENNFIDAAIALSSTGNLGKATPADGYGAPKSNTTAARVNLKVKKYGRTTGFTKGKVFVQRAV